MQIVHKNMFPGVCDKAVEFYAVAPEKVEAFYDQRIWKNFSLMPSEIHDILRREVRNPLASIEELEVYAFKHFGGLDPNPDICADGSTCNSEFFENHSHYFDNGGMITPAQLRVLSLIDFEASDIASILFIAEYTVSRHIQDMVKTSAQTRKQLIKWASKKGII